MDRRILLALRVLRRASSLLVAGGLGVVLLSLGLLLASGVAWRERKPAAYLPVGDVLLLYERRQAGMPVLSSFLSFLPPALPSELSFLEGGGQAIAVTQHLPATMRFLSFHRLPAEKEAYRRAQEYVRKHPEHSALVGVYLVLGNDRLGETILDPRNPQSLARDPQYRALLQHLPPSSEVLSLPDGGPALSLLAFPPFLARVLSGVSHAALSFAEHENDARVLSIVLPTSRRSARRSPPFSSLLRLPQLLFGVQGFSALEDFTDVLALLAGEREDLSRVFQGLAQTQFERSIGEGALTSFLARPKDAPYVFLVEGGSGGMLQWLFAVQGEQEAESAAFRSEAEDLFSARHSLARVRHRTLPSGKVVRDVIADASLLQRDTTSFQGYDITSLRYLPEEREFLTAGKGGVLVLSNSSSLLHGALDALAQFPLTAEGAVPRRASTALQVSRAMLEHVALPLSDSLFFQSLASFIPEGGRMFYAEEPKGASVRHTFRLEQ